MSAQNNIKGLGENYSFYDLKIYEEDTLRSEFGSTWTNPWDSPSREIDVGYGFEQEFPPVFGDSTVNPRFDIEYGPIVEVKSNFAPYVIFNQSVKLKAKSSIYQDNCIDCGFLEDVQSAMAGTIQADWALYQTPLQVFEAIIAGEYTSMGSPAGLLLDILGNERGAFYTDCYHDTNTPLNEEDVSLAAHSKAKNRIDQLMANGSVDFEYGDYVEVLEQVLLNVEEKDIPNLYMLLQGMMPADLSSTYSPYFNQAIEYLRGNVDCDIAEVIKRISTGYKNYLISAKNVDKSKEFNAYKEYFSLRAETRFSTSIKADFADKIKDVNLDCRLLRWMVETKQEGVEISQTGVVFEKLSETASKLSMVKSLSDGAIDIRTFDLFKFCGPLGDYPGEDVQNILEKPSNDMAFIGERDISTTLAKESGLQISPQVNLSHMVLENRLKKVLSDKNRTYQQVFSGSKPYSEVLAYRISKYKRSQIAIGANDQLNIVQEIIREDIESVHDVWLANSSQSEAIEYIDTQMKYNEEYVFVIWSYNMIIGSRYVYSNLRTSESAKLAQVDILGNTMPIEDEAGVFLGLTSSEAYTTFEDLGWVIGNTKMPDDKSSDFYEFTTNNSLTLDIDDDCEATFVASTIPMAIVKEVPFFVWQGAIVDNPPNVPDVNIVTYCGKDDQLLMMFNPTAGTTMDAPVYINVEDEQMFEKIKSSQGTFSDLVRFGTDNPVESYEVFRTEAPPSTYLDFSGNILTNVSTTYDARTGKKSNSISYIDSISPNTKYYYTFRAIDIHGHFSNPTEVFEVEIISDAGVIAPVVSLYDMKEESIQDSSKNMKTLLHIVPRITQAVVNEENSGLTGETANVASDSKLPSLGVEDKSVWGKTFKLRLTSRKTKRKFDINITFDTEHIANSSITRYNSYQ